VALESSAVPVVEAVRGGTGSAAERRDDIIASTGTGNMKALKLKGFVDVMPGFEVSLGSGEKHRAQANRILCALRNGPVHQNLTETYFF
jgi:hypothetical protein